MRRTALTLTGMALALTAAAPLAAQMMAPPADPEPVIKEWTVPWGAEGRPRDPFMPADGKRVFFVGQSGNYIGALDPESGQFQQYEIPEGTNPHNLIVDEAGMVWYAGNRNGTIGRLDPNTGEIKAFPMPDGVRDPHTLVFDRQGNIWFTAQQSGVVGRLNMASGQVDVVTAEGQRTRPYGIVMDERDHPWIVLFGTNRVMTVNPENMQPRYFDLPREDARPRRIGRTTDGMIWYGDWTAGMLGRLNPESGEVKEWQLPGGERARPYAMGVDSRDRVWVFQTGIQPNTLVGFDQNTEAFLSETAVPSGGRTVRHMHFHAPTNSFWFGADTGTIGQVILP